MSVVRAGQLCVGREQLKREIVGCAASQGAVLLFGGRQTGKTTVLRAVTRDLNRELFHEDGSYRGPIGVYVDLLRLPVDAGPTYLFGYLARLAQDHLDGSFCARFDVGGPSLPPEPSPKSIDELEEYLLSLLEPFDEGAPGFIFLVDEAKRIQRTRFPRAFQDNLFSFLYGGDSVGQRCSVVLTGAQDLYGFCVDETSPIGSRAARLLIGNLGDEAVANLVRQFLTELTTDSVQELACSVRRLTGGHAGLTVRLLGQLKEIGSYDGDDLHIAAARTQAQAGGLFEVCVSGLTKEARVVHDELVRVGKMSLGDVVGILRAHDMDPALTAQRVTDELVYCGFGEIGTDGALRVTNQLYEEIAKEIVVDVPTSEKEQNAWDLIEQVELSLRSLVGKKYTERWGPLVEKKYEDALGRRAWADILKNKQRRQRNYPRSNEVEDFDVLDFSYVGQLIQLMIWGSAWDMFSSDFRDKRELEDFGRDIRPVRNDRAHFRTVPDREARRCLLACEDLLAITERYLEEGQS